MAKPNLDDYVDVAARIQEFYGKYPDGRLTRVGDITTADLGNQTFVIYTAAAYRTADDPHPGIGMAWEPVPGKTSFTRDSELMNAETSAWGRAIAAVGLATKKIASAEEVRNRQVEDRAPKPNRATSSKPPKSDLPNDAPEHVTPEDVKDIFPGTEELITDGDLKTLVEAVKGKGLTLDQLRGALSSIGVKVPPKEIFTREVGIEVMKGLTLEQYGQLNNQLDKLSKPKAA